MPEVGYTKRRARWTRDAVLSKIHEWVEVHGEPPVASEWNPADCLRCARLSADRARAWSGRAERFYDGEWPWTGTVFKLFGGWNAALRAADVEVKHEGKRRVQLDDPEGELDTDALRALIDEAEEAMLTGRGEKLRRALCELADSALAWAREVPDDEPVADFEAVA